MFTGIIECTGRVVLIERERSNMHLSVESPISSELKIDQSVSHNGICLTVVEKNENSHKVTVIDETISRTNLDKIQKGTSLNIERCLKVGARLDGHMVQGHVDEVATCMDIIEERGSWRYFFKGTDSVKKLIVNKGSVCINGVSLTVAKVDQLIFQVAIIPYTYENTTFKELKIGDKVNIEYDIVGKYILKNYLS